MTSETLKNTVYIIYATLVNLGNFYHVKYIIKFIYLTHLHLSIFNFVFKFSAQNASESSWSRLEWQVLCFFKFLSLKNKIIVFIATPSDSNFAT